MKKGVVLFWVIIITVAMWRVWWSFDLTVPNLDDCIRKAVEGVGTVRTDPERKESGQVIIVEVEKLGLIDPQDPIVCETSIILRMRTDLYPRLEFGDKILFSGNLSKPFNFTSDSGRTFNYEGYLAKENIFYEIKSARIEVIQKGSGGIGESILLSLKRKFVRSLEIALGEPHGALAAGLVVGEKSALGKDLLDDFRTVGLIHIVVLSGYNITIVADAIRRLLLFLPRMWGIVVGGMGILTFGILVGGGATVVRSCLMAVVALAGETIRRDYSAFRALIFAGLIMIIHNPKILLNDPSFQLSFMATLGLIALSSPFEERLVFVTEKFGLRGIVASTVSTQIFVAPYILYMMGDLSIIGIVVNILVLPIIPLTMLMVFLTGVAGFFSVGLSSYLGYATHMLLTYELKVVEWFADVPLAAIHVPKFSGWITILIYGIIACGYGIFVSVRYNKNLRLNHPPS